MSKRTLIVQILIFISLVGWAAFALAYAMPHLLQIPDVDYSIFQYFGERIREGQLPYRDVYDHKPPLIFYINYLGVLLGGGSRWGIWALEFVAICVAGLLGHQVMKRSFGLYPAWLAAASFLVNLIFVHDGGNLTEEYALPFQFAVIYLLFVMETGARKKLPAFILGVLVACSSTLKQPLVGSIVAIGVILLFNRVSQRNWRGLWDLVWVGAGFVLVWAGWFAYFAYKGILAEFWEAAFAYNFSLSGISTNQRLDALAGAVDFLSGESLFYAIAIGAWLAAGAFLFLYGESFRKLVIHRRSVILVILVGFLLIYNGLFREGLQLYRLIDLSLYRYALVLVGALLVVGSGLYYARRFDKKLETTFRKFHTPGANFPWLLVVFAFIDFPVEIILTSLSGNNFKHYFMALLPSLTLLTAFFVWSLQALAQNSSYRMLYVFWSIALVFPLLSNGLFEAASRIKVSRDRVIDSAVNYIVANTSPTDVIYQWGNLPMLYTVSGRKSSSRFFFADPLFLPNYTSQYHTDLLLSDFVAAPPVLLLDLGDPSHPLMYEHQAADCFKLEEREYVQELASQLEPSKLPEFAERNRLSSYLPDYFEPPRIPPGMPAVYRWICENYTEETKLGEWVVYRYTPNRP